MVEKSKKKYVFGKEWGDVLEIGARDLSLKEKVQFSSYHVFDIEEGDSVDFVGDIHDTDISSDSFDTILAFEVLEHLYEPQVAVDEIYRILRPGGCFIGTTRFIYPYHGLPYDYYRFTEFALQRLFDKYASIEIIPHGSLFISCWDLLTHTIYFWPFKILNPIFVLFQNARTYTPSGFTIIARR